MGDRGRRHALPHSAFGHGRHRKAALVLLRGRSLAGSAEQHDRRGDDLRRAWIAVLGGEGPDQRERIVILKQLGADALVHLRVGAPAAGTVFYAGQKGTRGSLGLPERVGAKEARRFRLVGRWDPDGRLAVGIDVTE